MDDLVISLLQELHSDDWQDRARAANALGASGDLRAIEPLITALGDEDARVRSSAAGALLAIGASAVEPLIAALPDAAAEVRAAIITILGKLDDVRATDALTAALNDESAEVRSAAADALDNMSETHTARRLVDEEEGAAESGDLPSPPAESSVSSRERARRKRKPEGPAQPITPQPAVPEPEAGFGAASEELTPAPVDKKKRDDDIDDSMTDIITPGGDGQSYAPPQQWRHRMEAQRREVLRSEELAPPQFSTFYPGIVKPDRPYALMAFVHLESALEQVQEIAAGYAGIMGDQQQRGMAASTIAVDVGSLITFVPDVPGVRFDPSEHVVTWQPPHQSATFLFSTPATLSADLAGRVRVYQGALIIGEIPIHMQFQAAEEPAPAELTMRGSLERFEPIFASYSHRDTPVMEYFRRVHGMVGQRMLVDIYDLRAGDRWVDRLLEMIDQSAVFQLFWSQHSAKSDYCRQEWGHALRVGESRPRFIQPVWWDEPMPPPPPELAELHFQRVPLPPLTRVQLAIARLRGIFRRQ